MEVKLKVKINAGDLYDYMLQHTYSSASGVIGSGVGALLIVAFFMEMQPLFLIAGLVILLYLPWTLFLKSRQQALTNPVFKEELEYTLNEEGLTVAQGENSQSQEWDGLFKATSTGRSLILYTSPVNATILPRRYLEESKGQVIEIISTHMPPKKVKIRY